MEDEVMKKLESVIDPELYISIVDLGLVYDVRDDNGDIYIKMTLTTLGCPLFPVIEKDIRDKVSTIEHVKTIDIDLVFDPPWSMERMTERGKAVLGI